MAKQEQEFYVRRTEKELKKLPSEQSVGRHKQNYYWETRQYKVPIDQVNGGIDLPNKILLKTIDDDISLKNVNKVELKKRFRAEKKQCQDRIAELQTYIDQLDNE